MIKALFLIYVSFLSGFVFAQDSTILSNHTALQQYNYVDTGKTWKYGTCERDRFNDKRKCSMYKDGVMLLKIDGIEYVIVGKDHFPHRQSAIKIDDNATIYGMEGMFKDNFEIIEQMQKGNVLYYRYHEFPYDFNVDKSISLQGFNEVYQQFLKRYYKIP